MTRSCACCGKPFEPCPQVPGQTFCSSPDCQRTRKRLWQQSKRRTDPVYRENQRDAQSTWRERNPEYWRSYRESRPQHDSGRPRRQLQPGAQPGLGPAKMDASILAAGIYRIRIIQPVARAPAGSLIAEITPV